MANTSNHPSGKGIRGPHTAEHRAAIEAGVQRAYRPEPEITSFDWVPVIHDDVYQSRTTFTMRVPEGTIYRFCGDDEASCMVFVTRRVS